MKEFYTFEVGKPFPLNFKPPGFETVHAIMDEAFFSVAYWLLSHPNRQPEDVATWKKAPLQYGVFTMQKIPFFLMRFPGKQWDFGFSINGLGLAGTVGQKWLESDANALHMHLVHAKTGNLLAMRMIGLETEVADLIRATIKEQLTVYKNRSEVESFIRRIEGAISNEEMIRQTKMITL